MSLFRRNVGYSKYSCARGGDEGGRGGDWWWWISLIFFIFFGYWDWGKRGKQN